MDADALATRAIHIMETHKITHLVVLDDNGRPQGIVHMHDLLQAGMVMCLEPKLWHAGEYYLRVEDMVLIHPDRAEFLTDYDREQFQL